jgi:toxin HigB-1
MYLEGYPRHAAVTRSQTRRMAKFFYGAPIRGQKRSEQDARNLRHDGGLNTRDQCVPCGRRNLRRARGLDMLNAARQLNDLRAPPANRLEALTGSRRGQYSIRINDQWRVCFTWTKEGPADVEIVDYH